MWRAGVAGRADQLRVTPRNALILNTPAGWIATDARAGKALDVSAAAAALESAMLTGSGATRTVELPVRAIVPDVDDLDAVLSIAAAQRMTQPLTLTFRDGRKWKLPAAKLRGAITFAGGGETLHFEPAILQAPA